MRKTLKVIALTLSVILSSLLITYLSLPFILEKNVNGMTRTPVNIGSITFRPHHIYVDHFDIKNPKCAQKPTALHIDTIKISSPLKDYIRKDMVVKSIEIENIYVNVELYNSEKTLGNWQTIMNNINQDRPVRNKANQTSTLIKKVTLTNLEVELMLFNAEPRKIHIPSLTFKDLPTEEGLPTKQIARAVVSKLIRTIFVEMGVKWIIQSPVNAIKDVFSPLISPFKKKEDKGGEKAEKQPQECEKKP